MELLPGAQGTDGNGGLFSRRDHLGIDVVIEQVHVIELEGHTRYLSGAAAGSRRSAAAELARRSHIAECGRDQNDSGMDEAGEILPPPLMEQWIIWRDTTRWLLR